MSLARLTRYVDRTLLAVDWNVNRAPLLRILWLAPFFISGFLVFLLGLSPNSTAGLSILAVGFLITSASMLHTTWRFFKGYGSTSNFASKPQGKDEGLNG